MRCARNFSALQSTASCRVIVRAFQRQGSERAPAGAALLICSRLVQVLVPAAAYLSVPTFFISGVYKHYAGGPITLVGIVYPLIMLLWWWMDAKAKPSLKTS
jgi:hypothetical protein